MKNYDEPKMNVIRLSLEDVRTGDPLNGGSNAADPSQYPDGPQPAGN